MKHNVPHIFGVLADEEWGLSMWVERGVELTNASFLPVTDVCPGRAAEGDTPQAERAGQLGV